MRHLAARWWRSIVVVQDTPHRVAWGFAIGLIIGWQAPIMGGQMISAAILTYLLRGNIVAAMPAVWVTNPLTIVPIFYICNQVGAWFTGETVTIDEIYRIIDEIGPMPMREAFKMIFSELYEVIIATVIGGLIFGIATAIPGYFLVKAAVAGYQGRRMERRLRWLGIVEPPAPADVHPEHVDAVTAKRSSIDPDAKAPDAATVNEDQS
jgi:uncharacterized protein (DUF2062 family)